MALLLYTIGGGLSRIFGKGVDFSRFCAIIKVRGNTGDGYFPRLSKITAPSWEATGGYLFLCCTMYSSKRFRANIRAMKQSCRFHMSITSSLSEGEKTCSLRSWKEATATVLVFPRSQQLLWLFYYTPKAVVCQVRFPRFFRGSVSDFGFSGTFAESVSMSRIK